jgi:hypothetical protein
VKSGHISGTNLRNHAVKCRGCVLQLRETEQGRQWLAKNGDRFVAKAAPAAALLDPKQRTLDAAVVKQPKATMDAQRLKNSVVQLLTRGLPFGLLEDPAQQCVPVCRVALAWYGALGP